MSRIPPQAVLGLLIIAAGLLLTADNLGVYDADRILRFWPLGIVIVGLAKFLQSAAGSGRAVGAAIMFAGAFLTADISFGVPRIMDYWPLGLIVLGLVILVRTIRPAPARQAVPAPPPPGEFASGIPGGRGASGYGPDAGVAAGMAPDEGPVQVTYDESVSEVAVWAGKQRRVASPAFRRGDLTAVMGGVELDLRAAATANGDALIDVFVMWGGIEIWVPPDWVVVNKVNVLMGGVEDKSTGTRDARHRLTVRGFVVMGGLEIKT